MVPAFCGVNENRPPRPNWSEWKSAPESALTSWSTESWLTHVTFCPALTAWSLGANWMFFMSMVTGRGGAGAGVEEPEPDEPQPATAAHARAGRRSRSVIARHLDG